MEKEVLKKNFGDIRKLHKLPSLGECRALIHQNRCLEKRTPEQIKTWIDNQRKNDIRKKEYSSNKNAEFVQKAYSKTYSKKTYSKKTYSKN